MASDINADDESDPRDLVNVNGTLFFIADDGITGRELWKVDGATGGVVLVKDIRANSPYGGNYNGRLTNVGGTLYFAGNHQDFGTELWKSDGTEAGTVMVKDMVPGTNGSYPQSFTSFQGHLYFRGNDGANGTALWRTDGTEAGTTVVKHVAPQAGLLSNDPGILPFGVAAGAMHFAVNTPGTGYELWKSDGTEAGTTFVKDIYDATANSICLEHHQRQRDDLLHGRRRRARAGTVEDGSGGRRFAGARRPSRRLQLQPSRLGERQRHAVLSRYGSDDVSLRGV